MDDNKEIDISISTSKLYIVCIAISITLLGCFCLIFKIFNIEKDHTSPMQDIIFLSILILSFYIHELVHYFTFLGFVKSKNKSYLKLGFSSKYFAPYCHCSKPLQITQYRWAVVMPFVILSLIPTLIAIIVHSYLLLFFCLVSAIGCAGDFYILGRLKNYKNDTSVKDHPSKIGCIVFLNN